MTSYPLPLISTDPPSTPVPVRVQSITVEASSPAEIVLDLMIERFGFIAIKEFSVSRSASLPATSSPFSFTNTASAV